MIAVITGASSGIGKDFCLKLSKEGYDIIAVARDEGKLNSLKEKINKKGGKCDVFSTDLSEKNNCIDLYEKIKKEYNNIDLVINNAGFGDFGMFNSTSLDKEINMINTNIISVHILTKLFLKDMIKEDRGQILNVASIAGFMPGPLMSTYYSTKAYVVRFTESIYTELKKKKSNVHVSLLCPGPVKTNFNNIANVKFELKGRDSKKVVDYTYKKMKKNRLIILPGIEIKLVHFFSKIIPDKVLSNVCYYMQKKKE